MSAGPLLGLLYTFLLLNSNSLVLSLGLYYAVSGFLGSFHCFRAPLSYFFFLLGILGPFHHFRAPLSHSILLGILGLFHYFRAPLSHSGSFIPFYSIRHPQPVSSLSGSFVPFELLCPILFFWASSAHSNSLLLWAFAKSFGLPRPKLPHPLLLGFMGFSSTPYSLNSILQASLAHSCFSTSHIAHGFAISLSGLL